MEFRKPPTEQELIDRLREGTITFAPARLRLIEVCPPSGIDRGYDGIVETDWGTKQATYAFVYKRSSSPLIREAAALAAQHAACASALPLVIVPYLSEDALLDLERREISGIDLCGNGLIIAPDFRLWRTGQPNRYKDTRPIRNPFHGDSSIFVRCFVLRPNFSSLAELQDFARERTFQLYGDSSPSGLALGTASKVVQTLVEELVVRKSGNELCLQDPRRLLILLRRSYREMEHPSIIGKTPLSHQEVWARLAQARKQDGARAVATGISSAAHYQLLSGVEKLSLYVDDLNTASRLLEIRAGKAFSNIQLFEERKHVVYFDARSEVDILWASPVQTWLELASAGPREQEAAEGMEHLLISNRGDDTRYE